MTDNALLAQLATYRLEHDLSFEQLSAQMKQAGYLIRARALHLMLTQRLRTAPHDRTIYKVQRFLERVNRTGAKQRRRREGGVA